MGFQLSVAQAWNRVFELLRIYPCASRCFRALFASERSNVHSSIYRTTDFPKLMCERAQVGVENPQLVILCVKQAHLFVPQPACSWWSKLTTKHLRICNRQPSTLANGALFCILGGCPPRAHSPPFLIFLAISKKFSFPAGYIICKSNNPPWKVDAETCREKLVSKKFTLGILLLHWGSWNLQAGDYGRIVVSRRPWGLIPFGSLADMEFWRRIISWAPTVPRRGVWRSKWTRPW